MKDGLGILKTFIIKALLEFSEGYTPPQIRFLKFLMCVYRRSYIYNLRFAGLQKAVGYNGVPGILMPECKRAVSAKMDFFMRGVVLNTQ